MIRLRLWWSVRRLRFWDAVLDLAQDVETSSERRAHQAFIDQLNAIEELDARLVRQRLTEVDR